MDKDTKDCHILVVLGELTVLTYKLFKACVCLQAHIRFYHHHMFYWLLRCSWSCTVHSFLHVSAKRENPRHFISAAPQTNRIHISMLFKLWIKGSLAFLNFCAEDDDPPTMYTSPSEEPSSSWVPIFFLYVLKQFLAGSVTVWLCIWSTFMYLINLYLSIFVDSWHDVKIRTYTCGICTHSL